jgi:tripartite-type tricarboxylate transporter receptor subunit TctC
MNTPNRSVNRRTFLATSAAAASALAMRSGSSAAQAAAWPDKPVKLILPYQPGGATDLIARPWADKLTQAFGQQFVIENRGGASGSIGTEAASKAAPDGYTFMLTPNGPLSILPHFRKTAYDPLKGFLPVGRVGDLMNGYAVHPSVGITSFAGMVEYAKKNPGKLAYGSAGLATSSHLRLERTKRGLDIDILHVPYRGNGDAINDLLAGNIHLMNEINPMPHVKAGKLRLLNMSAPQRHPDFPDVPTDAELKIDHLSVLSWYAIWAPVGTPAEIIGKFNGKMQEIARTDDMRAKMLSINVALPVQTPDEQGAFLAKDFEGNGVIIKTAGIKLE